MFSVKTMYLVKMMMAVLLFVLGIIFLTKSIIRDESQNVVEGVFTLLSLKCEKGPVGDVSNWTLANKDKEIQNFTSWGKSCALLSGLESKTGQSLELRYNTRTGSIDKIILENGTQIYSEIQNRSDAKLGIVLWMILLFVPALAFFASARKDAATLKSAVED